MYKFSGSFYIKYFLSSPGSFEIKTWDTFFSIFYLFRSKMVIIFILILSIGHIIPRTFDRTYSTILNGKFYMLFQVKFFFIQDISFSFYVRKRSSNRKQTYKSRSNLQKQEIYCLSKNLKEKTQLHYNLRTKQLLMCSF